MRKQYATLTGMRGLAAMWVVCFHAYPVFGPLLQLPVRGNVFAIRDGFLAVDLFFILSGFVLSLAYYERFSTDFRRSVPEFFFARLCRIFPLHWFFLAILVLLVASLPSQSWGPGPFSLTALIASAALVQNWTHLYALAWNHPTWSLSAEWLAYLLFPWLTLLIGRLEKPWLLVVAAIAVLAILDAVFLGVGSTTLDHVGPAGLLRCLCEFSAGALTWRAISGRGPGLRVTGEFCAAFGVLLLVLVIAIPKIQLLAPFAFVALILGCALDSRICAASFGNRIIVFLGDVSFSIYVSHIIILGCVAAAMQHYDVANAGLPARVAVAVVFPLLVVGASYLTWRFVEMPSRAFARTRSLASAARARAWLGGSRLLPGHTGVTAAVAAFWTMWIVTATLGETAGDFLSLTLHLGYAASTVILLGVFVAVLVSKVMGQQHEPLLQWSVILSSAMAATTMSDFLERSSGFGFMNSALLVSAVLIVVAGIWRASLAGRVLSPASPHREILYWTAILLLNALGAIGGDFVIGHLGLGFAQGALLVAVLLACVAGTQFLVRLSAALLFWLAFVIARSLGEVLGENLARGRVLGSLHLGNAGSTLLLAGVLVVLMLTVGRYLRYDNPMPQTRTA